LRRASAARQGGQILVSLRVVGTVEAEIALQGIGTLTLKGFLKLVEAFNVVGPKTDG
jgi:class 3 adenylate cyclase